MLEWFFCNWCIRNLNTAKTHNFATHKTERVFFYFKCKLMFPFSSDQIYLRRVSSGAHYSSQRMTSAKRKKIVEPLFDAMNCILHSTPQTTLRLAKRDKESKDKMPDKTSISKVFQRISATTKKESRDMTEWLNMWAARLSTWKERIAVLLTYRSSLIALTIPWRCISFENQICFSDATVRSCGLCRFLVLAQLLVLARDFVVEVLD